MLEDQGCGQGADGEPIGLRPAIDMIDGDQSPGSGHVFHNRRVIPGQMLAEVTREETAVGVKQTSRGIADNKPDGSALENRFLGVTIEAERDERQERQRV
jgi:hypothetical protein